MRKGLSPSRQANNMDNRSLGFVASRFLTSGKGKINGRHWLTFCGICLGVFALLTVSSVMNGFDQDMRQRVIGTRAELRLESRTKAPLQQQDKLLPALLKQPAIKAASPVVRNELVLVNSRGMAATVCFGIDLTAHRKVSPVLLPFSAEMRHKSDSQWIQGIVSGNPDASALETGGIILGSELALSLQAAVGDTLQLLSPLGTVPTPFGMLPRTLPVRVEGIFIAGMPEYDRLYSYISLESARFFSGYTDEIDYIDLKSNDFRRLFSITRSLQKAFPGYKVENWSAYDSSLYNAMHFEKYLMLVILGLMFVIASFNMSGNIFRTVVLKRRSIGILKTLGYTDREVVGLFFRQGLAIAVTGICVGILLALALLSIQSATGFIQLPVGNMPNLILPVYLKLQDFILIPLVALLITTLSIWLPSRKAAAVEPVSLIREVV